MIRVFGTLETGENVEEITLRKGPLEARILTYGGIIRDLKFNGREMILGFDDLSTYINHAPYFGAIIGRCTNRIANATFSLDDTGYHLDANEKPHHLHGGQQGFHAQLWTLEQHDKASVLLKHVSKDMTEGYPGHVEVLCRYTLTGSGALRVKMTATTDKPTIINLTQHSYFNLGGSSDILDHQLEIAAECYLPIDKNHLPTGEIRNVGWTPYDFREGRCLRRKPSDETVIFDHNFCLATQRRNEPVFAAALEDAGGDTRMEVWTTEPGLQLYDGAAINVPSTTMNLKSYGPHAGLCLEAQGWPDSINHPDFPCVILRPEDNWTHITEFRFS